MEVGDRNGRVSGIALDLKGSRQIPLGHAAVNRKEKCEEAQKGYSVYCISLRNERINERMNE